MTILELREKRAKAWEATKAFLDSHRNDKGMLSAEDDATYSRMEQEITDLGKEIARLERQEALDAELNRPVNKPLTGKPMNGKETAKTGRATDEYRQNFWNMMRSKTPMPTVMNALQIGTDSEGGYLVPDEYERTLVEALEEENIFRQLAKIIQTSSGDRKIPVVATKGTASWIDEEGAYLESDDSFGQVSIGAYKLGTMIKVSEELLNDSVFIVKGFAGGVSQMANIGLNLIKGIWNGIGNAASWLWSKVSGFCSNLLSKIKGFFGISSPSREMAWVGDMLTQGLAGGIEDGAGAAISAAEDLNNGILGVMNGLAADMQSAVPSNFAFDASGTVGSVSGGMGGAGGSSFGTLITIQQMIVRSEDDIRRISQELYNLIQTGSRAQGRFSTA